MREAVHLETSNVVELPRQSEAIVVDNLVWSGGGKTRIDGLSMHVPATGVTALLGANGAGKSLTMRLVAGLLQPQSGSVRFPKGTVLPHDLAFVFQKPVLLRRTVIGNLLHALALRGVARRERQLAAMRLLSIGRLDAVANQPARTLSGGEQQRLAMVRAMAGQPRYLLLDEPTASLDPHSTAQIEELIRTVSQSGVAVLLVTHDRGQAERLAQEVRFMHQGRVVESGPAHGFFTHPQSTPAQAYLAGELVL